MTVNVTSVIEKLVGGQRSFESVGDSVKSLIENINEAYPGFSDQILEEDGELRRFVNIYLNDEDIRYLDGLNTELTDDDTVSILPALAGGE
ncbi:MAG: MoaD/ThiS family protein [Dehalococcoidia bacterium]|nr:MoaD/ThiS family protein [Dehalococcoidia bacterium]MCH2672799.1 MoaD/ThiS family protein [Dehalococcoidia bacterium]